MEYGFGGSDPRTDIRGGGLLSILNLVYVARYYPEHLEKMRVVSTDSSDFLLAIVSINVSSRLMSYFHMNDDKIIPGNH